MSFWNTDELTRMHRRFAAALRNAVEAELREAAKVGKKHVQEQPLFTPRTGALQRATTARAFMRAGGGFVRLANAKKYAAPIELGSAPHVITARRAKFLRFFSNRLGKFIFRRSVNHPGNKPYRFLRRARAAASGSFSQGMLRRMAHIAARF